MRHSFIPTLEQKILKRGYHAHALIVTLFLFSAVGIIGVVALLPAYVRVASEESNQEVLIDPKAAAIADVSAKLKSELERDLGLVKIISLTHSGVRSSSLVQDIVSARASVRISSINLVSVSTTTAAITIQGIAPNRESLVSFKTRLENLEIGNKVELPISELAKSKDIPFTMRFTRILP